MIDFAQLFDSYSRKARLYPALLVCAPALGLLAAAAPAFVTGSAVAGLVGVLAGCGFLYLCAELARSRGKATERRLLASWGGWPTTVWLRHSSPDLDIHTRSRYHAFLTANVPQLQLPTAVEEDADVSAADARYQSGVEWLKAQCRDRAPLVDHENASYGFRRNARGLRPFGIAVSIASILAQFYISWRHSTVQGASWSEIRDLLGALGPWEIGSLAFSIGLLCFWLFLAKDAWVRHGADAYARALLAQCDVITAKA